MFESKNCGICAERYQDRQPCLTFASCLYGVMFVKFNILWVKLLIRLKNEMFKKMH
jgi:hypothetical protein